MEKIRRIWKGELELEAAFWNWAVLGGLVVNLSSSVCFFALIMNGYPITALIVGYVMSVPYNVLVAVGVWRATGHYPGERRWADLARIVTTTGMVLLSVT
jgi:hypothetical protein